MPGLPADAITVPEASKLLRCHASCVRRWIFRGKLTGYRRVGRWMVSRGELLALVEQKKCKPPAAAPVVETRAELRAAKEWTDKILAKYGL